MDDDSPEKTFDIYDVYASGQAVGLINLVWDVGSVNRADMDFIEFSNGGNTLDFEVMYDDHGPLKFHLFRQDILPAVR